MGGEPNQNASAFPPSLLQVSTPKTDFPPNCGVRASSKLRRAVGELHRIFRRVRGESLGIVQHCNCEQAREKIDSRANVNRSTAFWLS